MTEGEILGRENHIDAAVTELKKAVTLEDSLHYDEPPSWLLPVRHSLGAFLESAARYAEAEQVYREDLKRWPNNGWSLYGLARSLRAQKKDGAEEKATLAKFNEVWAKADIRITSSCLCQPKGDANE